MQGLANQNIQVAIDLFVKGKADDSFLHRFGGS